jgi:hypothetical protein
MLAKKISERIGPVLNGRNTALKMRITQVTYSSNKARIYYDKGTALPYLKAKDCKVAVTMTYHFEISMTQEQAAQIKKDQAMILRGTINYRGTTGTSSAKGTFVAGLTSMVKPERNLFLMELKAAGLSGNRLGSIYLADPVAMIGGTNFPLK